MVQRGKTVARIRSSASEREIYMTWGLPTAVTTKDTLNMSPQPNHPDLKFVFTTPASAPAAARLPSRKKPRETWSLAGLPGSGASLALRRPGATSYT